eukprot:scaffold197575_cov31-Tisochrysis_lutea.AAC.1
MRRRPPLLLSLTLSLLCRPAVSLGSLPVLAVEVAIGASAGAVGALAVYPLDYTKTLLQTVEGSSYGGFVGATRAILERGGPLGFYRGVGTQLVGVAPEKTIKLLVNDAMRAAIAGVLGGSLPLAGEVAAGMTAGVCQVVVTNPLEVVKVGLQTDPLQRSPVQLIVEEIGLAGLYRGAPACMLRDASFSGILFPIYSHAKEVMAAAGHNGPAGLAIAGLLAAAPAAFLTTPADVVKTRIQQIDGSSCALEDRGSARKVTGNERRASAGFEPIRAPWVSVMGAPAADASNLVLHDECVAQRAGPLQVARSILENEGPAAFYAGALERVLRSSPQFAVTLALFDVLKRLAIDNGLLIS